MPEKGTTKSRNYLSQLLRGMRGKERPEERQVGQKEIINLADLKISEFRDLNRENSKRYIPLADKLYYVEDGEGSFNVIIELNHSEDGHGEGGAMGGYQYVKVYTQASGDKVEKKRIEAALTSIAQRKLTGTPIAIVDRKFVHNYDREWLERFAASAKFNRDDEDIITVRDLFRSIHTTGARPTFEQLSMDVLVKAFDSKTNYVTSVKIGGEYVPIFFYFTNLTPKDNYISIEKPIGLRWKVMGRNVSSIDVPALYNTFLQMLTEALTHEDYIAFVSQKVVGKKK